MSKRITATQNIQNKQLVHNYFQSLDIAFKQKNKNSISASSFADYMNKNTKIHTTEPFGSFRGMDECIAKFWKPLLESFPDLELQPYILMGDEYKGMQCVCCAGNFVGTFQKPWLDIPANEQPTWIRFHSHSIIENNRITHMWIFLDLLAVINQAGITLFPQLGKEIITSGPTTQDGIILYQTDEKESAVSLQLVNDMLDGLCSYDGQSLNSMGQTRYWDLTRMMWYGPSGIGTSRGLQGFQDKHQVPFLQAFPDRGILDKKKQPYSAQLADGMYVCDFGFPSMYATHTGNGWLGLKATNKKITMRVVDIWRRETVGGIHLLKENWVMIDIVDILNQFGINIFEMIASNHTQKIKRKGE